MAYRKRAETRKDQWDQLSDKSKKVYQKAWDDFIKFVGNGVGIERRPFAEDYLTYFDFLRIVKGHKGSTMWSIYSQLNLVHFRIYNQVLASFPIIASTLKSFHKNEETKRAAIFTSDDIHRFLANSDVDNERYWLVRKAFVVVAFFGGLRSMEMHNIDMDDLQTTVQGIHITINRTKQGGKSSKSTFLVPKSKENNTPSSSVCYSGILDKYLEAVRNDTKESSGPLFRSANKFSAGAGGGKMSISPLGANAMGYIGIEVATLLDLKDPHLYTGYSFRRSAVTQAVSNGASAQDLKQHFDIHSWQQVQAYTLESQKLKEVTAQ